MLRLLNSEISLIKADQYNTFITCNTYNLNAYYFITKSYYILLKPMQSLNPTRYIIRFAY